MEEHLFPSHDRTGFSQGDFIVGSTASKTAAGSTPSLIVTNALPRIIMDDLDGPADEKQWDFNVSGGTFTCRTLNDLGTAADTAFQIARSGNVAGRFIHNTGVQIASGTPTFTPGDDELMVSGTAGGRILLDDTDSSANEQVWDIIPNAGQLNFRAVNDADSVQTNWLTVDRTTTTIDLINFGSYIKTNTGNGFQPGVTIDSSAAFNPYGLLIDFSGASPDNNTDYFIRAEDSTTLRAICYY